MLASMFSTPSVRSRMLSTPVREAARCYGLEALITDDYLEVEARIAEAHPELVLGTQMERHVAKRLGIPCAVISTPAHVQDFPARYAPQMGFEGADVIFDTWIGPLMMGLEEHLLTMFREDFEFGVEPAVTAESRPSGVAVSPAPASPERVPAATAGLAPAVRPEAAGEAVNEPVWDPLAENELKKIPFFVRGKARRNTERFARERGLATITVETLYDAKAHFGR